MGDDLLWCLAVCRSPETEDYDGGPSFCGLLLQETGEEGCFRRVGHFELEIEDWFEDCGRQTLTII